MEWPSVRVIVGDEPMESETVEGVGSVSDVTSVEIVVVRTVASSGINTETDEPDESTWKFVDAVS